MREYLFVIVIAAVMTYAFTPMMRTLAVKSGAYTQVRDRDVHSVPIPRLGGVAIFIGFAAACLAAARLPRLRQLFESDEIRGVLIGAAIICVIGAIDDIRELDWFAKLGGQLIAAGALAFHGVQFYSLPLGEQVVLPPFILVSLTILVVLVSTNAVNFIDGLDGLASGIVGIAAVSFFAYAYLVSRTYNPPNVFSTAALISAAVIGCAIGFLPHNFFPARIFMGDSGALLFGLLLAAATISITGSVAGADVSANPLAAVLLPLVVPLAIFLLPLFDVIWAVIRRTRAGRRPWQPDAGHLHHRMLAFGHGHRRAVLLLWGWAAAASLGSVAFVFFDPAVAGGFFVVMLGTAAALTVWLPRAVVGRRRPQHFASAPPPPNE
ncbi:MAG: glycosyltransferase family 4 protein [Dermatophilaceae bacterium]|nr:undecaprenyl/decaprenyl-phosphate alpha-N-acetylglucosaminyl 1-phosphate transferase [Intrasporangiaceae bacterium]